MVASASHLEGMNNFIDASFDMLANTVERCFFKQVRSTYGIPFFKKFYETDLAAEMAAYKIQNSDILFLHDFPNFLIHDKMVHLSQMCHSVEERRLDSYENIEAIDKKTLAVVFTSNLEQFQLFNVNLFFQNNYVSWLLVHLDSDMVTLGPFFKNINPDHCYSCFIDRFKSNSGIAQLSGMLDGDTQINPTLICWIEMQIILLISESSVVNLSRSRIFFNPSRSLFEKLNYLPAPLCTVCG